MAATPSVVATGLATLGFTLFLDLLELAFGRILWFLRTLRFWLYFILHFGLSVLAAYLLSEKVVEWYLLAPLATFIGVAVVSNTNVKIAGYSLLPIADLFVSIKAKMYEQAAEDKAAEVIPAEIVERLQRLAIERIEVVHRAGLSGANWSEDRIDAEVAVAHTRQNYKSALISQLVKVNLPCVQKSVDAWKKG